MINIKKLLSALDHFIYKKIDDTSMPSSTNERTDSISVQDIYKYLNETSSTFDLCSSLEYYAATYYYERNRYIALVSAYKIQNQILRITHNEFVLAAFFFGNFRLRNFFVFRILTTTKLSNNAPQYYKIIGKKEQFYKIEVLKRYFQQTGDNNRLKERKLSPFEKEMKSLYKTGLMPFYIEIEAVRKVTFPPVFTGFIIKRHDYITDLFLARKRPVYFEAIMEQLDIIFGSQEIIKFYNQAINQLSDQQISDLYRFILNADQDPDFIDGKITLYSLILLRLVRDFKIVLPVQLRS